ncbi:MAG TPA: pyridoxal-phosphate dependent enzyme, partial [Xanthobacteraceae bacterium]|nr:pyridoxal-phosphate dependent enzyme [Xanthobacteraceae bacterium]
DESRAVAAQIQNARGYHFVPSFHRELVKGVATYALELFESFADLDVVYVPIGMGSGICGMITVRDLLGLKTEIVGVVAERAPAFALSFAAGRPVPTNSAQTFADGVACRDPQAEAFAIVKTGAARVVTVSEDEIAEAIRIYYTTTHNLAEGAGAAPLAALMKERARMQGRRVGLIMTGQNIDRAAMIDVLAGHVPGQPGGVTPHLPV